MCKNQIISTALLTILCGALMQAQLNSKYYGKKKDFEDLKKRIVLVEILEENPKKIELISKQPDAEKQLEKYRAFILNYNVLIRGVVDKYWQFNNSVVFKNASEISKIREDKSGSYALLSYSELIDAAKDQTQTGFVFHALKYTRLENNANRPDFKICIPSILSREGGLLLEADLICSLGAMQRCINYILNENKTPKLPDFCEKVGKMNCSRLRNYSLVIEKEQLHKNTEVSVAEKAYGAGNCLGNGRRIQQVCG